jgi:hypothetical protein
MSRLPPERSILVYIIERHPLDMPETGPLFRWIHTDRDLQPQLEALLGPHDSAEIRLLVDKIPGGTAWEELLASLLNSRASMVVTHLAPLSPAQRQQLIGVCAQTGARLITPGDAGRTRADSAPRST